MAMSKENKRKITLSGSFLVVSFFALIFVSFAWFTASRRANANEDDITVFDSSLIKNIEVYPYQKLKGGQDDEVYTFSKTPMSTTELGKYSIIGSGYQVLIKATLTDYGKLQTALELDARTNATFYHGEVDEHGEVIEEYLLHETGNSLTSIVSFYAFESEKIIGKTGQNEDDESVDYYEVTLAQTKNNGGDKLNYITSDASGKHIQENPIPICEFGQMEEFYMVIDYDKELIEEIYSLNLGNDVIFKGTDINDDEGNTYLSYDWDFYFHLGIIGEGEGD